MRARSGALQLLTLVELYLPAMLRCAKSVEQCKEMGSVAGLLTLGGCWIAPADICCKHAEVDDALLALGSLHIPSVRPRSDFKSARSAGLQALG